MVGDGQLFCLELVSSSTRPGNLIPLFEFKTLRDISYVKWSHESSHVLITKTLQAQGMNRMYVSSIQYWWLQLSIDHEIGNHYHLQLPRQLSQWTDVLQPPPCAKASLHIWWETLTWPFDQVDHLTKLAIWRRRSDGITDILELPLILGDHACSCSKKQHHCRGVSVETTLKKDIFPLTYWCKTSSTME